MIDSEKALTQQQHFCGTVILWGVGKIEQLKFRTAVLQMRASVHMANVCV